MEIRSLKSLSIILQQLIEKKLWFRVLIAIVLGLILGIILGPDLNWVPANIAEELVKWLALPGTLFMKLVQMIMIPLIFSSIITGVVSSPIQTLKKNGVRILLYFVFTTFVSVAIGLSITQLIQPGQYFPESEFTFVQEALPAQNGNGGLLRDLPDAIGNMLPANPLASMVSGEMLAVVIFTFIVGIAITQLKDREKSSMVRFLSAIQEICMIIIRWAMLLVPYAVFGLVANLVSTLGIESFKGLGAYVGTVLIALLIMVIVYLLLVAFVAKRNPFHFLKQIREVQLLAFSTTSSAAVMPLSIQTAQDKLNVSKGVSNLIIPLGTTINMDGTAIYQCVSVVFILQVCGLDLDTSQLLFIMFTIILSSIGTPGVPGAGIIVLASILESMGIPGAALMLIIGVERILGMFRTTVNVTGDLTATLIFDQLGAAPPVTEEDKA